MTESPRWVRLLGLALAIVLLLGLAAKLVGVEHGMSHAPSHGCHGP
jgi:hypothetical protein